MIYFTFAVMYSKHILIDFVFELSVMVTIMSQIPAIRAPILTCFYICVRVPHLLRFIVT